MRKIKLWFEYQILDFHEFMLDHPVWAVAFVFIMGFLIGALMETTISYYQNEKIIEQLNKLPF